MHQYYSQHFSCVIKSHCLRSTAVFFPALGKLWWPQSSVKSWLGWIWLRTWSSIQVDHTFDTETVKKTTMPLLRSLGDHEATHLQSASCRGKGSWGGWGHLYAVIMWESPTKLCKEMKLINLRTRGLPLYQKYISVKRPESSACKECFAFLKRWNMSNVYCEIHFKMFAPSLASEASVKSIIATWNLYNLEWKCL